MAAKKVKQFAAAALSASLIFSMGAFAESTAESDEGSVSLSIAGGDDTVQKDDDAAQVDETEVQTEEQTEAPVVYDQLETTNSSEAVITALDVSQIVEDVMPSIVAITTISKQEVQSYYFGSQEYTMASAGSGVIIAQNDSELLIATNYHIVDDATELTVAFSVDADDTEDLLVKAVVKGTYKDNDLAVIAVNLEDIDADVLSQLKIATLGSSSDLKVGEAAIVIGNALGTGQTVTTGIVSALEKEITTEIGTMTALQVDAAVNLGCSGGAILNSKGEVIAIVDAKEVNDYAESMGYGIPIDTAIPILQELINRQTREVVENHGYMGITVVPISDEAQEMYGMPAGAYVYSVSEGSAGEAAGIQKGDIIVSFDGVSVSSSDSLVELISYYEVGETVTVEVASSQNGEYVTREVEVTLIDSTAAGVESSDTEDDQSQSGGSMQIPDDNQSGDGVQQMPGNGGLNDLFGNNENDNDSNGTW